MDEVPLDVVAYALGFLASKPLASATQVSKTFQKSAVHAVDSTCRSAGIPTPECANMRPARALHFVETLLLSRSRQRLLSASATHCVRVLGDGSLAINGDMGLPSTTGRGAAHAAPNGGDSPAGSPPASPGMKAAAGPQLLQEEDIEDALPASAAGAVEVVAVAAGDGFGLAATACGACFSWGEDADGALGHGERQAVAAPKRVRALASVRVVDVAAGFSHAIAVSADGVAYSMGWGHGGRLGHGNDLSCTVPRAIAALQGLAKIVVAAAGEDHSVLVDDRGRAWAFGVGTDGQLGVGDEAPRLAPALVTGPLAAEHVVHAAAGERHTVFVTAAGTVYTCGAGEHGRLGHGDEDPRTSPELVSSLAHYLAVTAAAGARHTAVLDDEGCVWTFGHNAAGQLGHSGAPAAGATRPGRMDALPAAVEAQSVSAGPEHTLVLAVDGSCYAVGELPVRTHRLESDEEEEGEEEGGEAAGAATDAA